MIKCCECKELKEDNEFAWKKKDIKRTTKCKECHKKYRQTHYQNNKDKYIEKARKWNKLNGGKWIADGKIYMFEYLSVHPCVVCGESNVYALDFHHIDRKTKSFSLSSAYHKNLDEIKQEIAKCEVRCKTCHAKATSEQFTWYAWYKELPEHRKGLYKLEG